MGVQLHAVEADALGGPVSVAGLAYAEALGYVAKAGRPVTLTFLCDVDEDAGEEEQQQDKYDDEGA